MNEEGFLVKKLFIAATLILATAGCTHLQSVSTSSIPAKRGNKVSAQKSKMMFLLLNFSNDYVNDMAEDLANQCPNGKIQGLLTKLETVTYFPILVHEYRVNAEGYCVAMKGRD